MQYLTAQQLIRRRQKSWSAHLSTVFALLLPALPLNAESDHDAGDKKTLPTAVIIGDFVCISGYGNQEGYQFLAKKVSDSLLMAH